MPSHQETSSIFHRCSSRGARAMIHSQVRRCSGSPAGRSGSGMGWTDRRTGLALGRTLLSAQTDCTLLVPDPQSSKTAFPCGSGLQTPRALVLPPAPAPAALVSGRKLTSCFLILRRPLGPGRRPAPRPAGPGPATRGGPACSLRAPGRSLYWSPSDLDLGRGLRWLVRRHFPEGLTPQSHPSAGPGGTRGLGPVSAGPGPGGRPCPRGVGRALLWFLAGPLGGTRLPPGRAALLLPTLRPCCSPHPTHHPH
ncbi:unnamed protein product [Nyctereutes procyonoides]|uniref:(raccoon dog) hypothetical protein n=1 Tax=Nyctereutes procyonoides TaxID=34880 RepID=A0A811Y752_NYCPR|nr:unnamed protein product [Nyctereutes procyonoides]